MVKKILSLVLILVMVIAMGTTASASEMAVESTETKTSNYSEVLDDLIWQESKDIDKIKKEDTYTYTELTEHLAGAGLTQAEITNFIGERPKETRAATEVRYGLFKMNNFTYSSGKYILEPRFSVGLEYTIGFPEPNRIVSLGGAHIGKGEKCIFTGTIYYKLISGNSFYYSFYGDVYKTATTTVGGGVTIGIGENSSINFNASSTSNYLMNVSRSETYESAAMRP